MRGISCTKSCSPASRPPRFTDLPCVISLLRVAGVRPITTEPWADDAIRFTDLTVEKRGDHTDAGEREMLKVIQHLREHGCAPPDIQTKLYEESAEYQSALAYIRKERLAKHGAFGLTGTREDRFDALRDSLMC